MSVSITTIIDGTDPRTDSAPLIQAALDTGGTVMLAAGDYSIDTPLRLSLPNTRLLGDRNGGTRLFGTFGSGPLVLAQPPRPNPATNYKPMMFLGTEAGLDFSADSSFSVAYTLHRHADPSLSGPSVHVHCGSDYAFDSHNAWAIWDANGGTVVQWSGVDHQIPDVLADGTVELAYDGSVVTLKNNGALVLSFGFTGPVPQRPYGIDAVAVGYNPAGPHADMRSNGPPDAELDNFVFTGSGQVRLSFSFADTDGPFIVGTRGDGKRAYLLPTNSNETQQGGFEIADLTFMGAFGASGVVMYDTIQSKAERLNFVNSWHAVRTLGTTYGSIFREITGSAVSVFFLHTGQSESCTVDTLNGRANGFVLLTSGAVGGSYTKLLLTPQFGAYASVYSVGSHEINLIGGQIDDEGQSPTIRAGVIATAATVKFYGMQLVRQTAGPVLVCARGGTVHGHGSWLDVGAAGVPELLHFVDPPQETATLLGMRWPTDRTIPVTLTPQYCTYLRDGRFFTPDFQSA